MKFIKIHAKINSDILQNNSTGEILESTTRKGGGADKDLATTESETPLFIAVERGHKSVTRALIRGGHGGAPRVPRVERAKTTTNDMK